MTDLEAILLLNSCSKIHLGNLDGYLQRYGSLQKIANDDPQITEQCRNFELSKEMKEIQRHRIALIPFSDERYPESLREISAPPLVLYVRGSLKKEEVSVAMVGARSATPYGLKIAQEWAQELAACGVTVISGLALGIDGAAHEGALRGKGRTVAILGSGLEVLYPREHQRLAGRIIENGALISEFPLFAGPDRFHFPRRNRLISGLSQGVIVVEAAQRSGALVTASLAAEQGRELFAVPGPVDSPLSAGTNRLLRDGARVATSVKEVLEDLAVPILQRQSVRDRGLELEVEKETDPILKLLSDTPVSLDDLVKRLQKPVAELISQLSLLEIAGKVIRMAGDRFIRG